MTDMIQIEGTRCWDVTDTTIKVLMQRTQEQRSDNNERLCQVEDTEKKGGGGV